MLSMKGKRYKRQQIFSSASQKPNKKKDETMHYNDKVYISVYLGIHWNRFGILRVAGHTESWIRWINHIAMSRGHVISHLYKTSRLVRNAPVVQSICTLHSCFQNIGRFVTLKKIRSKIWTWKDQVAKNRVIVNWKEQKQPGIFSFWITTDVFFYTLLF